MNSLTKKRVRVSDFLLYGLIYISAFLSVLLVAGIIIYVFVKGARVINLSFLTGVTSVLNGTVGIAGNLVNTLYIIVITLILATPVGVGAAIYLNEYAKPGRFVRLVEYTTEILAGIPSIIFGLFGRVFFGEGEIIGSPFPPIFRFLVNACMYKDGVLCDIISSKFLHPKNLRILLEALPAKIRQQRFRDRPSAVACHIFMIPCQHNDFLRPIFLFQFHDLI